MVKDITFLPTRENIGSSATGRASTSKVTLEDSLIQRKTDEDEDLPLRGDVGGEETGGSSKFLSCSTDKTIKLWDAQALRKDAAASGTAKQSSKPLHTFLGKIGFKCVSSVPQPVHGDRRTDRLVPFTSQLRFAPPL